ncbi:YbfB/YjiJ family MFS transporter [Rhizobium cremeum]|uniref:YbfB/YjiJ family MFS transporter n=1 Tax=Rhizobium cremeum TaxID=2813827 RepID=UPI000DE2ED37
MTNGNSQGFDLFRTALSGALAMAAAMGFGRFSFTPILPGMVTDLGLSSGEAGLIAAANFAGYLIGAILAGHGWAAGRERGAGLFALTVSTLLLAAMAGVETVWAFCLLRFLAGLASAFAMIFITSVVLGHAARAGSEAVQSAHFGGVGLGIALSSLTVALVAFFGPFGIASWRVDWLAGAGISFIALVIVLALLPPAPKFEVTPSPEPALVWKLPLVLLTVSYGLFGFGYVVTATFVVTMARMSDAGPMVEFLTWFLAGCTAVVSLFAWRPVMIRIGLRGVYVVSLLIEAAGVLGSVLLPSPLAPIVGGLMLGATFMINTAYALRIGRQLAPASQRRALAFLTAAFGVGQILGPLVAGQLAEWTGSFSAGTVAAAIALLAAVLFVLPVYRRLG